MMILYKYVPWSVGITILEDRSVLFSLPETLNDPFDMPEYPGEATQDPASDLFATLRIMLKNIIAANKSGILSLTRTPTNSLMWAHYADSHNGMVIGIDPEIAGFTEEKSNLIPAQYGSVIYVSRREYGPLASRPGKPIVLGETHYFPADHYEKLQRAYLQKPIYWSYEEEVRVVKCLHGIGGDVTETPSGRFAVRQTDKGSLHLYALPSGAIREVYFGFRVDLGAANALALGALSADSNIALFDCELDAGSMSVRATPYEPPGDAA